MLRPYNANLDVKPFDVLSCVDFGDIAIVPGFTERSYAAIEAAVAPIVEAGVDPDPHRRRPRLHAAAPPGHAIARTRGRHRLRLAHRRLGQLLRREVQPRDVDAPRDRGRPGRRRPVDRGGPARLALRPRRLGRPADRARPRVPDDRGHLPAWAPTRWPRRSANGSATGPAFISFDIDVVDPAYAPGTGTPEAGGPSARDMLAILRGLTGIDFVGFDVVEVIPAYDPAGQTATLAANLAYEMLSLVALADGSRTDERRDLAKPDAGGVPLAGRDPGRGLLHLRCRRREPDPLRAPGGRGLARRDEPPGVRGPRPGSRACSALLDRTGVRATFFIPGFTAERGAGDLPRRSGMPATRSPTTATCTRAPTAPAPRSRSGGCVRGLEALDEVARRPADRLPRARTGS